MWTAARRLAKETATGTALGVAVPVVASFGLNIFDAAAHRFRTANTPSVRNPEHTPPQSSKSSPSAP